MNLLLLIAVVLLLLIAGLLITAYGYYVTYPLESLVP